MKQEIEKKEMGRKLNIAMLGHKRIPSREGGIEVVVEELATRMVSRGHNVTCYNRRNKGQRARSVEQNKAGEYKGIKIKAVPTLDHKGFAALTASFFASLSAAFGKYDVVHYHAEGPCAMLWIPKLFGKRCVATIHGLDHQRAKWGRFASKYILMGEKCAVRYADEVIVLSEGVKQYFRDTYGRETVFISNGVNEPINRRPDLIKKMWGLEKDGYILFLGRIVPEKGIKYLLEAFKDIETSKKLVIAGASSDTDVFCREVAELAAKDNRIVLTGFVEGQLLEELYSNAYIYTLPSDLEGMPLSLLEAMSYGNCCLTSDISECAEVVEDKAVLFAKSNILDLKDKLQMLCNEPETVRKYKEVSAEFILKKYNWDKVVDRTLEVY